MVPPWIASRLGAGRVGAHGGSEARYHVLFHGLRAPKYAAKTAVFAPAGAVRTAGRLARWASAEDGNWHLRQAAADRGDADAVAATGRPAAAAGPLALAAGHPRHAAVVACLCCLLVGPVPALLRAAVLLALVAVLARLGRPADQPITDRVSRAKTYRKLTAELVRRALLSVQLAGSTRRSRKTRTPSRSRWRSTATAPVTWRSWTCPTGWRPPT